MNLLKAIFYFFWRLWFYVLITAAILVMSPFLLLFSSRQTWYPQFFWLARNLWANIVLYGMGFFPVIRYDQPFVKGKSYMLVSNHSSMIDIMLMLKVAKHPFVFVGKKELAKIPIFGFFYKRVCILVDRGSLKSRGFVYHQAKERLDKGLSICIFPEGGVPKHEVFLDSFKDGAFRLAIDYQIPLVPISFSDNKKRFPWIFFKGSIGKTRARVHKSVATKGISPSEKKEITKLKNQIWKTIAQGLKNP